MLNDGAKKMKKVVGYIVSVVGIFGMVLGFGMINLKVKFLEGVAGNYIAGIGIVMIVVGIVISLNAGKGSEKSKQAKEEVPIYEGVGKKRKIVGYRKD